MTERKYGWKPDVPDFRDFVYRSAIDPSLLPASMDHTRQMPPVYDQGSLGSCTAQAIASVVEFHEIRQRKQNPATPSRLFIYYNERQAMGTVPVDSGAYIRDGIKSLHKYGYCEEHHWPYHIAKFANHPPKAAYDDAKKCKVTSYHRVPQDLNSLKAALVDGPVVFGFAVYDYFESAEMAKEATLFTPEKGERMRGGHAVTLVGYQDAGGFFIVRNSWGPEWGDGGYFFMCYDYVTDNNLADDFWTIRFVPQED